MSAHYVPVMNMLSNSCPFSHSAGAFPPEQGFIRIVRHLLDVFLKLKAYNHLKS